MSIENQQQTDNSELLADINYVNEANKREIERIKNSIRQKIAGTKGTDDVLESLVTEVSTELGHLKAKVKLTEKAISSIQTNYEQNFSEESEVQGAKKKFAALRFPANQIALNRNMLPVESVSGGEPFSWSSSEPEVQFSLAIDRHEEMEMRIRLFCIIKRSFARKMKIFIDGNHVKHWYAHLGSKVIVGCRLPAKSNSEQTKINIVLPDTHRPSELSNSADSRKLGIAISEIRFDEPVGPLARLLMRLRLKTQM